MKNMKKVLASSFLSASLILGATLAPVKKADAGVIVMAAGSTVAMPAGLAIAGMFGGFGAAVFSIYWAIDYRDKSWYALGIFLLDEHINDNEVSSIIAARYPELDSFIIDEISNLIIKHASNVQMTENGFKEVTIPVEELNEILSIVEESRPEFASQLLKELTTKLN